MDKMDIKEFTLEELKRELDAMGEPPHRAGQLFSWLYKKGAEDFGQMTDLPRALAARLGKSYSCGLMKCAEHLASARDKTVKFLWTLDDGEKVETVLIREKERNTVCLSTQAGCRFRCPFCASGTKGFVRNLSVAEITGQVLSAQKAAGITVNNIVFMGMG
ncbi:MAG: 23S rRNA (adenine(2503)-C(2))-methyltransferase RlmN, partial [Candidatus Omnitrophota bacterium]